MLRKNHFDVHRAYMTTLVVFSVLFLMPLWTQHQDNTARSKLHGCYSAQQVVNLADTLCRQLVPESGGLVFASFPVVTHARKGAEVRTWQVEYMDGSGKLSGILQWNADNGQLEQVSQTLSEESGLFGSISSKQAVKESMHWLEKLPMGFEKRWRLESAPDYLPGRWRCQFLSPNARVLVILRASDGQLLFAHKTAIEVQVP